MNNYENLIITRDDLLSYWSTMFPELSKTKLINLLKQFNEIDIETMLQQKNVAYDNNNLHERIKTSIDFNLCEYLTLHTDHYFTCIPFFHFYTPIFNPKLSRFISKLKTFNIIANHDVFLDEIIKTALESMFENSCRILVYEINYMRMSQKLIGDNPQDRFRYFSNDLLKNEEYILSLYYEYAALTELLQTNLDNYFDYIFEILVNTQENWQSIRASLNIAYEYPKIQKIKIGIGDGHRKGRSTAMLILDDYYKILYKPHSLKLEQGFYQLLQWLENQNISGYLGGKYLKCYTKQEFGWSEFINNTPCFKKEEIKSFYLRIGQYLCLLYILNSTDFHYENLIACGEFPMLIDMESIFRGNLKHPQKERNSALIKARTILDTSVYSVGLLPSVNGNDEVAFDLSGLGAETEQYIPIKSLKLHDLDMDTIKLTRKDSRLTPKENNPIFNDKLIDSGEYVQEIKQGFDIIYRWIIKNKNPFINVLQELFENSDSRFIFRSTLFYAQLLKISIHPNFTHNEFERKMILHRCGINAEEQTLWINRSEYNDLLRGDIPFFQTKVNDNVIRNARGEICQGLLMDTPMNDVVNKIKEINNEDLLRQLEFIELSFINRNLNTDETNINFSTNINHLTPEKWLSTATSIGEFILDQGIHGKNDDGNDDLVWFSTTVQGFEENIWKPDILSYDLYNGNSGIALFLGYLGYILDRKDFKQAAFQAMEIPKQILSKSDTTLKHPVGAFSGFGGILYTLYKLSQIYNDETNVNFIISQANTILELIKQDNINDIVIGTSGILGVALSISQSTIPELVEVANKIINSAYQKLMSFYSSEKEIVTWPSLNGRIYSGFSHGNAGIAAYLYSVFASTKDPHMLDCVKKSLTFERSCYSQEHKNWLTSNYNGIFSNGWCHGAPGILLSKLLLLNEGYSDSYISDELHIALETTYKHGIGNNPTYCHGDLGSLSILNFASESLQDKTLKDKTLSTYQDLFNNVLSKEWRLKNFRCCRSLGLMIGISGFGYSMIKNYAPEEIPEFLWLH